MKKSLSLIAFAIILIGTVTTSPIVTKLSNISNIFKTNNITSSINNELNPLVNWTILDKNPYNASSDSSFYSFNEDLGIICDNNTNLQNHDNPKAWFVDGQGQKIKEIKLPKTESPSANLKPSFVRFNDNLAFYKGNYYSAKPLSSFSLINSDAEIVADFDETITKVATFNDNTGIIADNKNSWFVDNLGNKTKNLGKSLLCFTALSSENGIFVTTDSEVYLLDSKGTFIKIAVPGIHSAVTRFNDRLAVLNAGNSFTSYTGSHSYLINNLGNIVKDLGETKAVSDCFVPFNDDLGIFYGKNDNYIIDNQGKIIKTLDQKWINFTHFNDRLGIIYQAISFGNTNALLINSKGDIVKDLGNTADHGNFARFNDKLGLFLNCYNESDSTLINYFLNINPNPKDIADLENSIHFSPTKSNQKIKDIDNLEFSGKLSNGTINFSVDNTNITEVLINNKIQPLISGSMQTTLSEEGKYEISIKNAVESDLKYNLYIKLNPNTDNISNVTGKALTNYVGVINDKSDDYELANITVSSSEVNITYSDNFLTVSNTYSVLDENFNKIKGETHAIFQNTKISSAGNYLIETLDSIGNKWQQYLTVGTNNIENYWNTNQGKIIEKAALKHKYTDDTLYSLNAKAVKHVINQYNSNIWDQPLELNDITHISLNVEPDVTKNYSDLTNDIINAPEFDGLKLNKPTIEFQDMSGKNINNSNQTQGQFQIKIIANHAADVHYSGETTLLPMNLKINLNSIPAINLDDIIVDTNKTFNDLTKVILENIEKNHASLTTPTIHFFDINGKVINPTTYQFTGKFQIVVTADITDPNWTGSTNKITLNLGSNWIPIDPDTKVDPSNNSILLLILGIGLPVILIVATTTGAMFYRKRSSKIKIKHDK